MANLLRKGDRTESTLPTGSTRTTPAVTNYSLSKKSNVEPASPWDIAQRWVQTISKEDATRKQWKNMYGWMADYDSRGNLKPNKDMEENSTRFSNTLPNSSGRDYGWRLHSASGEQIRNLQRQFDDQHRKPVHAHDLGYDW